MNNRQVAHSFVYGNSGVGSNFSTDGRTLYSYSSIMARKYHKNGKDIILVSDRIRKYSNTSQKHHGHLVASFNPTDEVIYIDEISNGYIEDVLTLDMFKIKLNELIELYKKQSRARKTDYSYWINRELKELELFIKYSKIDKRSSTYKTYLKIIEDKENIAEITNKAIESEKKEKKRIAKANFEANKKRFEKFTKTKCPYSKPSDISDYNWLKIEDNYLKTNSHIKVDLESAKSLYKLYKWGKNIVGCMIGQYTILKANKELVQIGCHKILPKELDRVLG